MNLSKQYISMHENSSKELIRGGDRLTASKTVGFGDNVKIVAVDRGKTISLHLRNTDGQELVELSKKGGSISAFENQLKKKGVMPLVSDLKITNESIGESLDLSDKNLLDNKKWAFFDKLESGNTFVVVDLGKTKNQDQYFMMVVDSSGTTILKRLGTHPSLKGASNGFYKNRKKEIESISESGEAKIAAESIARKAGLRASAVEKLIKEETLDPSKFAQAVANGKIDAMDDVMIALVGNDRSRKKSIDKIKSVIKKMK